MSSPSKWPLPATGIRFLSPAFMVEKMARHPLTKDCYPTAMGFYPSARGHHMERRRHDDNLLLYCTDGKGELHTDSWRGSVSAGQIMVLPQGVPHTYTADRKTPWTVYWVHFQGASTGIFTQYLGYREGKPVITAGVSPTLTAAFSSLMEVRSTGYSTRAFINAANQLRHLLTQTALEIRATQASNQRGFALQHVQDFMRANINQNMSLDTLAATANMSKYHFSNRYKKLTGYSPMKHFLNMKMEHACNLLDTSDMTVKAIAANLGYDDPLYFSRIFGKTVGMSPRSYRASIRK